MKLLAFILMTLLIVFLIAVFFMLIVVSLFLVFAGLAAIVFGIVRLFNQLVIRN